MIFSTDLVFIPFYLLFLILSFPVGGEFAFRFNGFVIIIIYAELFSILKSLVFLVLDNYLSNSLFEYKKSFAPNRIQPFFIRENFFNHELYDLLSQISKSECQDNYSNVSQALNFLRNPEVLQMNKFYYWSVL